MSVMTQELDIETHTRMTHDDRKATEAYLFALAGEYLKANGAGVRQIEDEMNEVMECLTVGILPW